MKLGILGMVALMAVLIGSSIGMAAKPAYAGGGGSVVASVNPSAVGQEITFTVTGASSGGNVVVYAVISNADTGDAVGRIVVTDGVFTYTFTESGTYEIIVIQQRNGKQTIFIGGTTQTVN